MQNRDIDNRQKISMKVVDPATAYPISQLAILPYPLILSSASFLLGLFLLSVANVKAQTQTQNDSLTMENMMHNLPDNHRAAVKCGCN